MTTVVLTEIHGRELGLTDDRALLVRSGVILTPDGSPVSFPYGIDYTEFGTIPQRIVQTDYQCVLEDAGKHLYHPATDTNSRTWAVPPSIVVDYQLGHVITFVNEIGAGTISITCGDTMWLAGTTSTSLRTLAAGGLATAMKVAPQRWIISGSGLT